MNEWKKAFSSESGFTLLEVIVAILIITMLVATFGPLIVSSVQRIRWAGEQTKKLYEARSEMERAVAVTTSGPQPPFTIKGKNVANEEYSGKAIGKLVKVTSDVGDFITFVMIEE